MQKLIPKRFVDKVEILIGPNLIIPNADSWTAFYNNSSPGSTYIIQQKIGLSAGVGLIRSIGGRFEIQGRFLWERKGYLDRYATKGDSGKVYQSDNNFKNDYVTISLVPIYFLGARRKVHVFSGISYSLLTKSRDFAEQYVNGQLMSKGIIILDNTAPYDINVLVGLGYFYSLGKKTGINFRIQGNMGLTDSVNANKYIVRSNSIILFAGLRLVR
jgi:hypothetical protein